MSEVVNKAALVTAVAGELEITKKMAEAMVNSLVNNITGALKQGGTVKVAGLGTFRVVERASRKGVNPQTGQPLTIPACHAPAFKFTASVKEEVKAIPVAKGKKAKK